MSDTKLIILRGPSGSGKSSTAKALFKDAKRDTVLIEQDHYRFIFKPKDNPGEPRREMILSDVLIALKHGYDVILEGILTMKTYNTVFEALIHTHAQENYMFFFDTSFEETLKRHATRETANEFGEEDMKAWYVHQDYSYFEFEKIIPQSSSLQETITTIKKVANI
jgi:deoxyadenosine/deoxycytidine kinase